MFCDATFSNRSLYIYPRCRNWQQILDNWSQEWVFIGIRDSQLKSTVFWISVAVSKITNQFSVHSFWHSNRCSRRMFHHVLCQEPEPLQKWLAASRLTAVTGAYLHDTEPWWTAAAAVAVVVVVVVVQISCCDCRLQLRQRQALFKAHWQTSPLVDTSQSVDGNCNVCSDIIITPVSLIIDSGDGMMSLNGDGGGSSGHNVSVSLMVSASGDDGGNEDGNGGALMASSTWQFSMVWSAVEGRCGALRDGIVNIGIFLIQRSIHSLSAVMPGDCLRAWMGCQLVSGHVMHLITLARSTRTARRRWQTAAKQLVKAAAAC